MPKINLTSDQIDAIIVKDLKENFKIILREDVFDRELIESIKHMLRYYMPVVEADAWIRKQEGKANG